MTITLVMVVIRISYSLVVKLTCMAAQAGPGRMRCTRAALVVDHILGQDFSVLSGIGHSLRKQVLYPTHF